MLMSILHAFVYKSYKKSANMMLQGLLALCIKFPYFLLWAWTSVSPLRLKVGLPVRISLILQCQHSATIRGW